MSTQTINIWEGDGVTSTFNFSFINYDPEFNTLEGYVKDADTDEIDSSYTWEFDPIIETSVNLNKALEFGKEFILQIVIDEEVPVWYNENSRDINDKTLNDTNLSLLVATQAVADHRTNARTKNEDMNNHRIINLKDGSDDTDAANLGQVKFMTGDAPGWAAQAQLSADAAKQSEIEAENAANSAAEDADDAQAAADAVINVLDGFGSVGNWSPTTTYNTGDWVQLDTQSQLIIYLSVIDDNLNNPPPEDPTQEDPNWNMILYTNKGNENFIAEVRQVQLEGDGVTTDFNLTALDPNFQPRNELDIYNVIVETDVIANTEYTVTYDENTSESTISFNTAPPAITDPEAGVTYNVLVIGASPKTVIVEDPVPVGTVFAFSKEQLPQGYLECDGSTIDDLTYPDLVEYLNPGQSTAVLPDYRGVALRGLDNGRGLDPARGINTYQEDAMQPIVGTARMSESSDFENRVKIEQSTGALFGNQVGGTTANGWSESSSTGINTELAIDSSLVTRTADETRMKNVSVVYGIKAFGAIINSGVIDLEGLNQKLIDLQGEVFITDDVQSISNYTTLKWRGRITSEGGEVLESATDMIAAAPWSQYTAPVVDTANKRYIQVQEDAIGVPLQGDSDNPIDFSLMDDLEYWTDYEFTGDTSVNDYFIMSLGKSVDTDSYGLLLRMYSGRLNLWISSNGTTWNVASAVLGSKTDFTTGRYQFKLVKDKTAGTYEVFWSDDNKLKTDPTKVWTSDILINSSDNVFYTPTGVAGMIGFGADAWDYNFSDRFPPEYTYYENCGFEDLTVDGFGDIASLAMSAGMIFSPYVEYHQFVGYEGATLITELCHNSDGSDLQKIDGDKARVFSGKTFDNGLGCYFMNYIDNGNEREYQIYPSQVILVSNSTTDNTYDVQHQAPAIANKISLQVYVLGGYIYTLNTTDGTKDGDFVSYSTNNLASSGQHDRQTVWAPNPHRLSTLPIRRDSYDSNSSSIIAKGYSLIRGEKL